MSVNAYKMNRAEIEKMKKNLTKMLTIERKRLANVINEKDRCERAIDAITNLFEALQGEKPEGTVRRVPTVTKSTLDLVSDILHGTHESLHVRLILQQLSSMGKQISKGGLVGMMFRDKKKRFENMGQNVWRLRNGERSSDV